MNEKLFDDILAIHRGKDASGETLARLMVAPGFSRSAIFYPNRWVQLERFDALRDHSVAGGRDWADEEEHFQDDLQSDVRAIESDEEEADSADIEAALLGANPDAVSEDEEDEKQDDEEDEWITEGWVKAWDVLNDRAKTWPEMLRAGLLLGIQTIPYPLVVKPEGPYRDGDEEYDVYTWVRKETRTAIERSRLDGETFDQWQDRSYIGKRDNRKYEGREFKTEWGRKRHEERKKKYR